MYDRTEVKENFSFKLRWVKINKNLICRLELNYSKLSKSLFGVFLILWMNNILEFFCNIFIEYKHLNLCETGVPIFFFFFIEITNVIVSSNGLYTRQIFEHFLACQSSKARFNNFKFSDRVLFDILKPWFPVSQIL